MDAHKNNQKQDNHKKENKDISADPPKETHRVQKLLSNYGYCSRRKAEELIIAGRVKVNGKTIAIGDQASETDKICVDDRAVDAEKKVCLIFNKPTGCATALTDKFQRTIMHYIRVPERVFPIGRLDFNTSGLLLLTNDGDFANSVMHPRYEVNKTYMVELNTMISKASINKIESGIVLEDGKTSPAKVKRISDNVIDITIHEGKNKIVRRMMTHLGYSVRSLERVRIGNLTLVGLKPGEYRPLAESEKKKIFE